MRRLYALLASLLVVACTSSVSVPDQSASLRITKVPCTVILATGPQSGTCTGTFTAVRPSPSPSPTSTPPPPVACANPAFVYHPTRLHQISPCQEFRGIVLAAISERDGDTHIWAAPDPGYESLLNSGNLYHGHRALVLEIVPDCTSQPADSSSASRCPRSHIHPPVAGAHIDAFGPWVLDMIHGWQEIHPVTNLNVTLLADPLAGED